MYKETGSMFHWDQFSTLRRATKRLIEIAHSNYMSSIENCIARNPTTVWAHVNGLKNESRIPAAMSANGVLLDNPLDIINEFPTFFSVYEPTNFPPNHFTGAHTINANRMGDTFAFSAHEIGISLRKLNNKMIAGLDRIPSSIVKSCYSIFDIPLEIIFNQALREGVFPKLWKMAKVIPVFKSGRKSEIQNYRPISVLSNFSKAFEVCICNRINSIFSAELSTFQHGFTVGRSTNTNIVSVSQFLKDAAASGRHVDVVYTGLSKAFDKLSIPILPDRLRDAGIPDSMLRLLHSYLVDRCNYVCYNGYKSRPFSPTSGVPQGSNLGPLLFNIFLNQASEFVECEHSFYADDARIFKCISGAEDCVILQDNVNAFSDWCHANLLAINIQKCECLSFYTHRNPILFDYTICGSPIRRVETCVDLGVAFDRGLSFYPHIEGLIISAKRILGFITRTCKDFQNTAAITLWYNVLSMSKLNYGCLVWSPLYKSYIANWKLSRRIYGGVIPCISVQGGIMIFITASSCNNS